MSSDADDLMAKAEKSISQMRAYEPAGTRHQDLHGQKLSGTAIANPLANHIPRLMPTKTLDLLELAGRAKVSGLAAGVLSAAVLIWRGRKENGAALSALNAPSHWVWGEEAMMHNQLSVRYTGWGAGIHHVSSLLWSTVFELAQSRHRRRNAGAAVCDAVAVTALAAIVDLRLVPKRLTPGFERRLSNRSLAMVYGSFALGLALAGLQRLDK